MELLTVNAGRVREARLHDRDYLVVPLRLIVPGVLPGSKGRLLYPPEEVVRNVSSWNGMPLVGYHPVKDGVHRSARSPDVLAESWLGTVYNAKSGPNSSLDAEGWFDVLAVEKFDKRLQPAIRILPRLRRSEPIELSTGLFTDNDWKAGVANGREYDGVARNYRPDHVAVLPDEVGACSVRDGCGVLVNRRNPMGPNGDWLVANCDCMKGAEERKLLESFSDDQLGRLRALVENALKPKTEQDWLASAPPRIVKLVQSAEAVEKRERDALVQKLNAVVANAKHQGKKAAIVARMRPESTLEELNDLYALVGDSEQPRPEPIYNGAVGGPTDNAAVVGDEDDILPLPASLYGGD